MSKIIGGIEYLGREDFSLWASCHSPVAVNYTRNQKAIGQKRVHDFWEMATIVDGGGELLYHDAVYQLHPGDTFMILPGIPHQYLTQRNLSVIHFQWYPDELPISSEALMKIPGFRSFSELEPQTRPIFHFELRLRLSPEQSCVLQAFSRRLEDELRQRADGFALNAGCIFSEMLVEVSRFYSLYATEHFTEKRDLPRMEKVLAYLDDNFRDTPSRRKIAGLYGSSETTFCRNFKCIMGETFSEYVLHLRLRHARKLLLESEASISEIASACGFCDSNYLCYRYRKKFGISPHQFRLQKNKRHLLPSQTPCSPGRGRD